MNLRNNENMLSEEEVLKEILGIGESLSGHLLIYEALGATFRNIKLKRNPTCQLCGENPSITDLSIHE